jgi:hypothetical protein
MKTNCKNCCFLQQDEQGIGCSAGQYCIISGDFIYTPGCCKLKRSSEWAKKYSPELNKQSLISIAKQETSLLFDLIIIFDECIHDIEDIERTMETEWMQGKCQHVIICDVTGRRTSNGHSLEYFNNYAGELPLKLDCSINAENPVRSIRRNFSKTTSQYFLVMPAGKILSNVNYLADEVIVSYNREVLWMFPQKYGETILSMKGNTIFSLYLKKAFSMLTKHCTKECVVDDQPCQCVPFFNDLKDIESETKSQIFLSQAVDSCVVL